MVPKVLGYSVWGGRPHPPLIARVPHLHGFRSVGSPVPDVYRFACPRAIFLTLRFCDPRAYSRGFKGCSVLRFFRAARFAFLRSSLLSADVLAMNALYIPC